MCLVVPGMCLVVPGMCLVVPGMCPVSIGVKLDTLASRCRGDRGVVCHKCKQGPDLDTIISA